MTNTQEPQDNAVAKPVDKAQYLVVAVLLAVGAFLVYDTLTLDAGFAKVDPVGPRFFPLAIGIILIVLAVILAIAIPRGSVGEADAGEDVDPNSPGDWRTVAILVALFVAVIVLVQESSAQSPRYLPIVLTSSIMACCAMSSPTPSISNRILPGRTTATQ